MSLLTFGSPTADFAFIAVGNLVAGGPLLWSVHHRWKHGHWPAGRRLVPIASYLWGFIVAEVAARLGFYSPCAMLLWFAAGFVLGLWVLVAGPDREVRPLGSCAGCGYDLTGNVSGVCPECGRPR